MTGITTTFAVVILAAATYTYGAIVTTFCPPASICRNGDCLVDTDTGAETCSCGEYYSGTYCDTVLLTEPDWTITSTSISFFWPENITITGYQFACYEKYVSQPQIVVKNITESSFDTLTFTGLVAGARAYVICIVDSARFNASAADVFDTFLSKNAPNCFSFITMYDGRDPATMAAYAMAIMIGTIFLISLIVKFFFDIQQNKIRLNAKVTSTVKEWIGLDIMPEPPADDTNTKRNVNTEIRKPSVSHVDRIIQSSASSPNLLTREGNMKFAASSGDIHLSAKKAKYISPDKRSIGSQGSRGSVPRKSNSNLGVVMNLNNSRPSLADVTFEGPERSKSAPGIDMM